MATYKQIGYGSQGSDVTELQKQPKSNVSSLKRVQDYQNEKSNLSAGDIAREKASGSFTGFKPGQNAKVTGASTGAAQPASNGFQYAGYQESDTVKKAEQMLNEQLANKPGAYQSQWQTQLNDTLNKILNREKFSYDLNGDALYQQYKDQYMLQGQQAMMDTMGQAQAMTGGYGNSYAQTVGQQTYQGYLQQLNDKIPELYQLAYDQYNQEGQDLLNQYSMIGAQDDRDYGRYRDSLSDWQAERDYLTGRYDSERDYDYGKYTDERDFNYNSFINDRNYQYQQGRDAVADEQWQKSHDLALDQFAWQKDRAAVDDEHWQAEFDEGNRQFNDQMDFNRDQAAIDNEHWNAEFDESNRQFDEQMGLNRDQLAFQQDQFSWQQDQAAIDNEHWQEEFDANNDQWQKSYDLTLDQWDWEKDQAAAGGDGTGSDENEFHKATYSRTDDNGNLIWYINGKEVVREPGANPYTGTVNPDVKNGYFPNSYGYQPDNINGKKLSKSGKTDVVNGVTQNVWKTPDGKLWIWDGTQNKYLEYDDGSTAGQAASGQSRAKSSEGRFTT